MKKFSDEAWHAAPKIILGIDIGTTHSAVSFAHMFEGGPQAVQHVNDWPGQESHKGDSKIPTLVYYDRDFNATCFGAEALTLEKRDQAEDEGWALAKYFKLHLHPQSMKTKDRLTLHPLPFGVSLAKIYVDFMGYLLRHTKTFFEDRVVGGPRVWETCSPTMMIVLTHPNGWSIREQNFMRQALRKVGPEYEGYQVAFVTEGEASVHFCMFHSNMDSALNPRTDLIVCDAGGSTVDTTAYHVEKTTPILELKERKASACIQSGGVFVDIECEKYLANLLTSSDLDEEDVKYFLSAGVRHFESTAKKEFSVAGTSHYIDFRDTQFTDESLGIKRGRMNVGGSIMEGFFSSVADNTIRSIKQQMEGLNPKHLLLVGGFGESRYLRRRLTEEFSKDGCQIALIEDSTSKAAADGCVIWAAKLAVVGRHTRVAYGTTVRTRYNPKDPEHEGRKVTRGHAGYDGVAGRWSEIIDANVLVNAQGTARRKFLKSYKPGRSSYSDLDKYTDDIWVFHGTYKENPGWIEDKDGNINHGFEKLCQVEANLGGMRNSLIRKAGPDGSYEVLEFYLVIELGGTELCAHIEWVENGNTRRGPISILPEPLDLPPVGMNMS